MIDPEDMVKFDMLMIAGSEGRLCLVRCTEKNTGQKVMVLGIVTGQTELTNTVIPVARFFEGDPFDQINPPFEDDLFRPDRKEMN